MNAEQPSSQAPQTTTVDPNSNWQPRFWTIWLGQALSLVGSALTQFVLMWWITKTTNSAGALALAGVMALLPQALLGPIGGTVADRLPRRWVMVVADSITALCMVVLVVLFATESVQLWHVYALMFIRSSMQAFQAPAAAASTAMLVPTDWLPRVAGLNQTLQGIMTVAAAPLGALALAILPLQAALMIDVVTAILGIVPLLLYSIPQPVRQAEDMPSFWQDFRAGVGYVWNRSGLRWLYGLLFLVVLTVMPTFSLMMLLVKDHFGGGPNEIALMEGLSGLGMIAGGLLIVVYPLFRRRIVTVLVSFVVSCGTVALTALAPGDMLWLAVVWWVLSGITFATGNAPMTAILQTTVPNVMQGRVLSLLSTMMGIAGPIGLAIAAPLGEAIGVRGVFVVGGALSALVCGLGLLVPTLMRVEDDGGIPLAATSSATGAEHRESVAATPVAK
jgi:MFS transporter, DHA3 family, macrolide efflux protein